MAWRRLQRSYIAIWQRSKFIQILVCFIIVSFILMTQLSRVKEERRKYERREKSYVYLRHVSVHFDLKGSPPKLSYLTYYLPILNMYGVNSIIMEYEDMFPYTGNLVNISSINAYRKTELLRFLEKARSLDMEVIPLIQTFGHMEFVLKLKEFAHLRELDKYPADICPSNPESITLITDMLTQVIDLHAEVKPLQHIHIGCDEVGKVNNCLMCLDRKLKNSAIYAEHVIKVASLVKEITPEAKVLIWADMLYRTDNMITIFSSNTNIEAVEWQYGVDPNFDHNHFYKLHKHFKNIWIASAFKGADGRTATAPNIKDRFQNHLSWMKFILDYKFGGENKVYQFNGIILTGWSRYTHMALQCELLPVAMPSLILNLLLIQTVQRGIDRSDLYNLNYCEFFHKYLSTQFSEIFKGYGSTETNCAFENTFIHLEHSKLFDPSVLNDCFSQLHEREFECQRQIPYVDTISLESTYHQCRKALQNLADMKKSVTIFMVRYYKQFAIKGYLDEIIQVPARKIHNLMQYLNNCTNNRFWGRRY